MGSRRRSAFLLVLFVVLAALVLSYAWIRQDLQRARSLIQQSAAHRYPAHLEAAFLAAEDPEFFQSGRFRALTTVGDPYDISLTNQFVRGVLPRHHRPVPRLVKELLLVLLVDLTSDKQSLMTAYLDHVYLGRIEDRLLHGVSAASRAYFGKNPDELDIAQSAMLAGLARNPQLYSPNAHPENARKRRDEILHLMRQVR